MNFVRLHLTLGALPFARSIRPRVLEALNDTPAVLVHGARQVGKTTLVRELTDSDWPAKYVTLDDAVTLAAAAADPDGFVTGLGADPVAIDEVQRVPELFRAMKLAIDRARTPGRYLLTGSANVMVLPSSSESLAGRMEIVTLWPLAEAEIEEGEGFVDRLFEAGERPRADALDERDLVQRLLRGGYPEILARRDERRRAAWFGSYLTTILQRDVREISNVQGLAELPRLLALLASRVGGLLRFTDLSSALSIPQTTLKRYFALLEATHLVRLLPAWSSNLGLRLTKAPKLFLGDTGLASHLLGLNVDRLARDRSLFGSLLENLAVMEITKQATWSADTPALFHFRTTAGREVDIVLEDRSGRLVGVEVKASRTVSTDDFKGLFAFRDAVGDRFVSGALLYTGETVVPFSENIRAIPVSALWAR